MATKKATKKAGRDGKQLTAPDVESAKASGKDEWLIDGQRERGVGRLVLRVSVAGTKRWYYRYTDDNGRRVHLPLGDYAKPPKAGETPQGLSLADARAKVHEMRTLHRQPEKRDVRAVLVAERGARQAAALEKQRAAEAAKQAKAEGAYTVRALAELYVKHLEDAGKQSARDARGLFRTHVYPHALADKPAADVTPKEAAELLRRIVQAGKGRTAAKVRSYLRAAYQLALRAELEPNAPAGMLGFNLTSNPVAVTGSLAEFSHARDRVLSEAELRGYLKRLATVPEPTQAALRLLLLLGGQRPAQLLRATVADVNLDADAITLRDSKGKRKQARLHVLPLPKDARKLLSALVKLRVASKWPLLFTSDGKRQLRPETLSACVNGLSADMLEAKEAREPFQLRDIRRTCETLLAALGIAREVRAQLLSHGLGGVQVAHYDRHTYADEKRAALEAWETRLREIEKGKRKARKRSNVVPIATAKRTAARKAAA